MKSLLRETIVNQALAGSFGDLGSIESVEVVGSSGNDGTSVLVFVAAGIAAVVILGAAYWYGTSGKREKSDQNGKDNNVDTSDEEYSDGEQNAREYHSSTGVKEHTQAAIPDNDPSLPVQQAEPGSWFGWKSNDEHPDDEQKVENKEAASEYKEKESSWVAGWFGPTAPKDEEC